MNVSFVGSSTWAQTNRPCHFRKKVRWTKQTDGYAGSRKLSDRFSGTRRAYGTQYEPSTRRAIEVELYIHRGSVLCSNDIQMLGCQVPF